MAEQARAQDRPAAVKPARWANPANKLFPHQVGFTGPPHDFDAAPSDFLRMAPETVGVHGRLLHVPTYGHELSQRVDNFHLLEEFVRVYVEQRRRCGAVRWAPTGSTAGVKLPRISVHSVTA